jgi:hypothetical protein
MCELANPQKHRDDVDNDNGNWDRDFHDGVELYKLHFVQSGRPYEFRVMTYRCVAAKPILYAHRMQAVPVEEAILLCRALPALLHRTNVRLQRMYIAVIMYHISKTPALLQQYCPSEYILI